MRPLPKFAKRFLKKPSSKKILGLAAVAVLVGSFAACAAKNSGGDSSDSDFSQTGSAYDKLPYHHNELPQ